MVAALAFSSTFISNDIWQLVFTSRTMQKRRLHEIFRYLWRYLEALLPYIFSGGSKYRGYPVVCLAKQTHRAPDKGPKKFLGLVSILQDILLFVHLRISQYMYRFVAHILSILTDSSCIFQYTKRFIPHIQWVCTAKFLLKIHLIPCILHIHPNSFPVFSVYKKIYSTYSPYT